ncbi:MAG TPA: DUF4232 domain-containing protein [Mycobacteriales bacterium]|nr:DUF4232 domain-containing protein [Mycobacteriales bacterium]
MTKSTMYTPRRVLAAAGVTAIAAAIPLTVAASADAAPNHNSAPSSCRPANYRAVITNDHPSMGNRHYRVTLRAAAGYANCTLQGSPQQVIFAQGAGPAGVNSTPYGDQSTRVTFGPGHPVHFDIQTPNTPGGAPVTGASFTLSAPGGVIPGTGVAGTTVPMQVDKGTQIGPIQPGA